MFSEVPGPAKFLVLSYFLYAIFCLPMTTVVLSELPAKSSASAYKWVGARRVKSNVILTEKKLREYNMKYRKIDFN